MGDAHLQCVNNHYAKFEYKEMKTVGVTDYTNQTPPKHFRWKKTCLKFNPPPPPPPKLDGSFMPQNNTFKQMNKKMKTI